MERAMHLDRATLCAWLLNQLDTPFDIMQQKDCLLASYLRAMTGQAGYVGRADPHPFQALRCDEQDI